MQGIPHPDPKPSPWLLAAIAQPGDVHASGHWSRQAGRQEEEPAAAQATIAAPPLSSQSATCGRPVPNGSTYPMEPSGSESLSARLMGVHFLLAVPVLLLGMLP